MRKNKGFTLIELLVVISIIALLLSILMPSLQKVKEQAKLIVCASTAKQLNVSALMYTVDNNDSFHTGYKGYDTSEYTQTPPEHMWPDAFRPYYENPDTRLCVSAKQPLTESDALLGNASVAWGIWDGVGWDRKGDYGSYGFNAWLNNPSQNCSGADATVPSVDGSGAWPLVNFVRKVTGAVGSTNNIPVFVDCWWVQGYPGDTLPGAMAPEFDGDLGLTTQEMKRFAINRHGGKLNAAFLDGSARKIGVKELWNLKWHRNFDTRLNYYPNVEPWPDWMSNF